MDSRHEEARRWVRRKQTFYRVTVVYLAFVVLWFAIDVFTGGDWWFYWPTLGAGVIVAIIGISMFGVSGLFGGDWQRRQMDKYLERHPRADEEGTGQE
jgi:hypothetical protein